MKTLYLLRHAKSSWAEEGIKDENRPLNSKGVKDAHHKAWILSTKKTPVDLLVTSPAFRALNTAIIVAGHIKLPFEKLEINPDVYDASLKELLKVIEKTNNNVSSLLLVGHNPGLTELANYFINDPFENIPTSGLVCIEFKSTDWKKPEKGEMKYFDFSKS